MEKKSLKINALLSIIKQCCAIIFPMITFPYVSRTLGVEAYGKVNFSSSIVTYISLIAGLGVSSYAIREGARIRDYKEEFKKFANEVFSINLISTVVAFISMFIMLTFWEKLDHYKILICILSVNVLLTTLGTDWINSIYEDFFYITIRYIVCQSIAVITTLFFVKKPSDIVVYAFLSNLGTISANILNIFYIRQHFHIRIKFTIHMNLKVHIKPILLLFGNMISSMIYMYADTTMLGLLIGDIAVGYYTVASKIYFLIKQLINAISNVIVPRLSNDIEKRSTKNKNYNTFDDILGILLIILLPTVTGLIYMGKEIIYIIAGKEYASAYPALAILSVALICSTIACFYVSVVMLAMRKDKEILFASTISAIINIILNFILIPIFSFVAAAVTTLIAEFVMMIIGIVQGRKYIKAKIRVPIVIGMTGALEVFLICFAVKKFCTNYILSLMVAMGICMIVYLFTLVIC